MELKTLKDFDWEGDVTIFDGDMTGVDDAKIKNELKEEAIKWVKFNMNAIEKNKELPDRLAEHSVSMNEGAIIFIKHFFNITEKDLK